MSFTHLHTHSHYSLLQALPKVPDLIAAAKKDGMTALALTDNGNLYGAIEFYKECKKAEIKPIIGLDAYVSLRDRHQKQAGVDNRRARLVLLAKNITGYKNLLQLVTISNLEGFYYKPRIDHELIEKYKDGLVAILPSFSAETSLALKHHDNEKAKETAKWYKSIFGNDCFLELTHHPEIAEHENLMKSVRELGVETGIPLVAAHDVYYISPDDKKARETLLSVQNGGDGDRAIESDDSDFSFISGKQAEKFFIKDKAALENTAKIADACNLELDLGRWVFPNYQTPDGLSHDEELRQVVYKGLREKNMAETPEIKSRIEYELKVIKEKGYSPYFLVVSDLLRYAHTAGILTNTRGSAAGSIVSYLASITTVDPIFFKLPFERFLNPERPSAPDIDMDIADDRRDDLIAYARKKYGADRVAQVGTFGTMMARGAVRDVSRALGYEYAVGDKISKLIPMGSQGFPMTLDHAMEITPELKALYKSDADVKIIIDLSKKIEGCARHISVHAAGVVIAPSPLTDFTPLQEDPKGEGKIITQYDMYSIDEAGLLKFDFLGIKNLSILADAVDRVKKLDGVEIDIENLPLDDKKTFEMLAKGDTIGVFQLNGTGMTRYLKDLRPSNIHDISLMIALYRPGPMENISEYILRKHKQKPASYIHPKMKSFLENTYGVLVYQDDLLMTAIEVAGYSWGEVDKFRKAVGKKIPEEMAKQHIKFVDGCIAHSGMSKEKAESLWKLFEPFQGYGFNKAHAASYSKVSYQTAYMKANFPAIYMSAVLTADSGDVDKIGETIAECKRMGIPVLPPSINESFSQFTIVKGDPNAAEAQAKVDRIRFGLVTIKNFGQGISSAIIEARKVGGHFKTLGDFLGRVRDKNLNKKSLEALIKAGALDDFGERGQMLGNMEKLLEWTKEIGRQPAGQDSLFGGAGLSPVATDIRLEPAPAALPAEKLAWEKELLGLYISGHPLDKHRAVLEKRDLNIKKAKEEMKEGMEIVVGGLLEEVKPITTKANDQMAFVRLADLSGSIEVVVFPRTFAEYKNLIVAEKCVAIKGRISHRNGEVSLIAEKIKELA